MRLVLVGGLLVCLAACGGGGGGSDSSASVPAPVPPPAPVPAPDPNPFNIDVAAAHRFLVQSTMGVDSDDIEALQAVGYEQWIEDQVQLPASRQLTYMAALPAPENNFQGQANRIDAWFAHAVKGNDQLRQRVAFALSELMVVSDASVLFNTPAGLAHYYDTLSLNAFGNFRDLIEVVTLHPAMGVYLSMLGNEKPDLSRNIRPDENYARELMQLFTLGVVELNLDGSVKTDTDGNPIPTYSQAVIEGFAHVYTGWTFGGSALFTRPSFDFFQPMQAFTEFHDQGQKTLLGSVVLPAGQTPEQDLSGALDNIFNHPNVAPFISRQLIQKLVTANPSPAYIARIAAIFNDDGFGERGNLKAVIKAVLLDTEARSPFDDQGGKLVEPILRLTQLWRAYDASAANGRFLFAQPDQFFAQAPLRSPSVFNFFSPAYAPPGELSDAGLVSPEMQITNETTIASTHNYLALAIYLQNSSTPNLREAAVAIDIASELALAADSSALISRVAERLLGREPSETLRLELVSMLSEIPESEAAFRVTEVIHGVVTSIEFAVQQ